MLRTARFLLAATLLALPAWSQSGPTPPAEFFGSNPNQEASFTLIQAATPGTNGLPRLTLKGSPEVGDSFRLKVKDARACAHGCLIFSPSFQPTSYAKFGATFYPGPKTYTQIFHTDGKGKSSSLLHLKRVDVSFAGVALGAQAVIMDPQAQGSVAFTDAAWITFGYDQGCSGDDEDDDEDECE